MKVLRNTLHVLAHAFYFQPAQLWMAGIGFGFLVLGLIALIAGKVLSFGLVMMAYTLMLAVPCIIFVFLTRTFISNRRLILVPGFGVAFGLALLLYTLATSFTPVLIMWFYGIPGGSLWMGFRVMIVASLYLWLIQYCLISRYGLVLSTTVPFAVIVLINTGQNYFAMLMRQHDHLLMLFAAVMLGWLLALLQLSRRRDFRPARLNPLQRTSTHDYQFHSAALRSINLGGKASPHTSLLLSYIASVSNRLMNLAFPVLGSPLMAAVMITLVNITQDRSPPFNGPNIFLVFSLVMASALSWTYGEIAARSRLLWLRSGLDRHGLWQLLEREVSKNLLLTWCLTGFSALLVGLFTDKGIMLLLTFQFVVIAGSLHNAYLHLNSRINHWSNIAVMTAMLLSTTVLALVLIFSIFKATATPVIILNILMLALTLCYRHYAIAGFIKVDWLVLRPAQRQQQPVNWG